MSIAHPTSQPETPASRPAALIGRLGALVLGAILLVGAFGKIIDPDRFAELISGEGLDFLLPTGAVVFLALALEIGLGIALLLDVRTMGTLIASGLLVVFFLALTGFHYYEFTTGTGGGHENCGCFGNLIDRNPEEAFWWDLATLLPAAILSWFGRPRVEDLTPMWKVITVSAVTLGGLAFTWIAPSLPLDDFATRLSPGVTLAELCAGEGEDRACLHDAVPDLEDDPETPDEAFIVVIADPLDKSIHDALNRHVEEGREPYLIVLSSLTPEEIEDLQASELAPSFDIRTVPQVLLRPLYRALPRSFLVKDGKVAATASGLPVDAWATPADE